MKRNLLSIITLVLFSAAITAQNVYIPDANFKAFLVGYSFINSNGDSEIQMSEAEAFTGELYCYNLGISDFTGIEAFTGMIAFGCNSNLATTLDLGQNTALINLYCSSNNLTSLDVSQCTALEVLFCDYNNFTTLDVSQNTALTLLQCNDNNLESLNISQNTALETLNSNDNNLSTLDVSQNIGLTNLNCSNNDLSTLDVSQNTALLDLKCFFNNLSTLDVSQNTTLTQLECNHNSITSLDLSQNIALTKLYCMVNNLSTLSLSQNTALIELGCNNNNIGGGLDVSQIPDLTHLFCSDNNLSSLKLKNLSSSTMHVVNAHGNPNLTCIEVDDVAAGMANITYLNIGNSMSLSTSCSPIVNIPDANFKAYLVGSSSINTNSDSEIQVSEAEAFTGAINCQSLNISDLTGIEAFTVLTELRCYDNNLSNLDVSQNTALTSLLCGSNPLGTLDVSQNTALEFFEPHNNNLSVIDVSQNTALVHFVCVNNNLSSLDLSQNTNIALLSCVSNSLNSLDLSQNTNLEILSCNSNNLNSLDVSQNTLLSNFSCISNNLSTLNMKNINTSDMTYFNATLNPNLTCIDVDDMTVATSVLMNIDPQTSFSENCNLVAVTSISVQGQGGVSTITTLGGTLQLEAAVLPMNATDNTYTWSVANGTGSASIDANGLLTAVTDGIVTVIAAANDGSGVTGSIDISISNQTSSVAESNIFHDISIFPNPATTQILIHSDSKIESIMITDIMGMTVKEIDVPTNSIDVSDLSNGVYLLQMQVDGILVNRKIIKN